MSKKIVEKSVNEKYEETNYQFDEINKHFEDPLWKSSTFKVTNNHNSLETLQKKEEIIVSMKHKSFDEENDKNGMIQNGMKYIMFPVNVLRFCIFGSAVLPDDKKKSSENPKTKEQEKEEEEHQQQQQEKEKGQKNIKTKNDYRSPDFKSKEDTLKSQTTIRTKAQTRPRESSPSDPEDPRGDDLKRYKTSKNHLDHLKKHLTFEDCSDDENYEAFVTAEESDSSTDRWSTAESSASASERRKNLRGKSRNHKVSHLLEEPMDISVEEPNNMESLAIEERENSREIDRKIARPSNSSGSSGIENSSGSSVEEEIVQIFKKQCNSSDEDSSSFSESSGCSGRQNYPGFRPGDYYGVRDIMNDSPKRSKQKDVTRKIIVFHDEEQVENQNYGIIGSPKDKKEDSIRKNSRGKGSPRYSRGSPKVRSTRKSQKKCTRTPNVLVDEDVEMTCIDGGSARKRYQGDTSRRKSSYGIEDMEEFALYAADNEDSNDGTTSYRRNEKSSKHKSPLTDTSFGSEINLSSDSNYNLWIEKCRSSVYGDVKKGGMKLPVSRAPPGFPVIPQHPPIPLNVWNNYYSCYTCSNGKKMNNHPSLYEQRNYPPAPAPLRHLYYDYPEFMSFADEFGVLKISQLSLADKYQF